MLQEVRELGVLLQFNCWMSEITENQSVNLFGRYNSYQSPDQPVRMFLKFYQSQDSPIDQQFGKYTYI